MDSNGQATGSAASGWLARSGRFITRLRRFTGNLLFLLLLAIVVSAMFGRCQSVRLPQTGALLLNPAGAIVEQPALADPLQGLLNPQLQVAQVAIGDLVRAVDLAAEDPRINTLLLQLDEVRYLSLTHAEQLADAVARFRATGKTAIAYGYLYEQSTYLVASAANAVYLHPLGQVILPGLSAYRLYWKGLLERLGVQVDVFRAGTYKSFVEPYLRQDMSPEVRIETRDTLTQLWQRMLARMSSQRDLPLEAVDRYTQDFPGAVSATGGDLARAALEAQLVDELLTDDEARVRQADSAGRLAGGDPVATAYERYLAAAGPRAPATTPYISVLTLEGAIMLSAPEGGAIGAEEVVAQLRQISRDTQAAAVVVRVNSPGGSSFASELIRKELELLQVSGKPVVISMGPTAASGGYWISATADAIVAEAATITGSIGAFSLFPSAKDTLAEYGITSDGVGTTPLSGGLSPVRGLNEPTREVLQASLTQVYEQFVNLVARGRELPADEVESLASGRIWTGAAAVENGLADALGGLDLALERAAALAELEDWGVNYLVPERSARSAFLASLLDMVGIESPGLRLPEVMAQLRPSLAHLKVMLASDDPRGVFSYCELCPQQP